MKLEHRKEKIVPIMTFAWRLVKYTMVCFVLILISLTIGILGYHQLAHASWLDSLHMSSMILTGMGPVVEMKSDQAKIFSSFYALYSGVAFLSITAVFFAPIAHRILHILNIDTSDHK